MGKRGKFSAEQKISIAQEYLNGEGSFEELAKIHDCNHTAVQEWVDYIDYYNNERLQRNLGVLSPMENTRCISQHKKLVPSQRMVLEKSFLIHCPLDG